MNNKTIISSLGAFFLILGFVWTVMIYQRCEKILPRVQTAVSSSLSPTKALALSPAAPEIKEIRSPYAKEYHFILFWVLTCWEILCSTLYMLAGLSLLRRLFFAGILAKVTLSADLMLKILAMAYMYWCAIPLALKTGNENILIAYFMSDASGLSRFSSYVSGLRVYFSGGYIFFLGYVFYLFGLIYFFSRTEVKKEFQPSARA